MRIFTTIVVALAVSSVMGQTTGNQTITNPVRTNLTMRGLYGNRSNATERPRPRGTADAVRDALRAFAADQNPDGSWGTPEAQPLATPLVFMAFMGQVETEQSPEFGNVVVKARTWLLNTNPTNYEHRIAVIVALAEHSLLRDGNGSKSTNDIERIRLLLLDIIPKDATPWTDFLNLHRLPPDVIRPTWADQAGTAQQKWATQPYDPEPTTIEGYLALRLAGTCRFRQGVEQYTSFNHNISPGLIKRQVAGFYPCAPETAKYACTALAIQCMQIYYAYAPAFWQSVSRKNVDTGEVSIKIK